MPCNVRFQLRQLQPLVPHSTWRRTVLHGRRGGSTEGPDHAVRGQVHRDSWQLLSELWCNQINQDTALCKWLRLLLDCQR